MIPADKAVSRLGRVGGRLDDLAAFCHDLQSVTAAAVHECHGLFLDTAFVDSAVEDTAVDLAVIADKALKDGGGITGAEDPAGIAGQGYHPRYRAAVGVKVAYRTVSAGQCDFAVQHTASRGVAVDQGQYGLRRSRAIRQLNIACERMTVEIQRNDLIAQIQET